ncbi:MAG TPA: transketolase family protein [Candidatus Acidoferrum sp.]|nr:transketolase family protein [Candidatus Acidoferrum sp.]
MKATRDAYGEALAEFGAKYDFVVLDADLSKSTKTATFKKAFPERFVNCGIAEGNMMGVAAGIATTGRPVFASTFAVFAAGRAYDAVRNGIAYPHLNVKIAASHAGISVGEDGASHQCLEDIALMRAIPGMVVCCPADAASTRSAVLAAIEHDGPVYLRLGRLGVPDLYEKDAPFAFGKGNVLRDGENLAIVACGLMVAQALKAADLLQEKGLSAAVIDMHTVKPLDIPLLEKCARKTGRIVTVEEHNILGGLGGAVCEALSEVYPTKVQRIGMEDRFGQSGKAEELLSIYGLTGEGIAARILAE